MCYFCNLSASLNLIKTLKKCAVIQYVFGNFVLEKIMEVSTIRNLKLRKYFKQKGGKGVQRRGFHGGTGIKKKKEVPKYFIPLFQFVFVCFLPW